MCGIGGLVGNEADLAARVEAMTNALPHRGPDGRGMWIGEGVGLGSQRLAIVDLEGGQQPFVSSDGLVLVANGEIYNHARLRRELDVDGVPFRSECDVEVILHGYRAWGLDVVTRLRGQFALALWDERRRRLLLARDRWGIAPLVYTERAGTLAFASEVKALLTLPGVATELDPAALDDFLAMRYVPEPRTFWKGISHIRAGHLLVKEGDGPARVLRWYEPPVVGTGRAPAGGMTAAVERFEDALEKAIARRRQGDVEVGLYLSGGLDSSVVGALAVDSGRPLRAWSHGFDSRRDETDFAALAARHIGSPLTRVTLRPEDVDALPAIVRAAEQPVANSDMIGLWRLAAAASRDVRVVMCGEGADELFGSYPHQQLLAGLARFPRRGLRMVAGSAEAILKRLPKASPYPGALADPVSRQRLIDAMAAPTLAQRYELLTSLFLPAERSALYVPGLKQAVRDSPGARREILDRLAGPMVPGRTLDRLIELKLDHWLPGYHLGRENRIAMAHGLEARYPFLDDDVASAILMLPASFRTGGRRPREKRLLRLVAEQRLPNELSRRPKGPVRVPLDLFGDRWKQLAGDMLSPDRVRRRGLFDPAVVANIVRRADEAPFIAGRQVFALVLIELWHEGFEAA